VKVKLSLWSIKRHTMKAYGVVDNLRYYYSRLDIIIDVFMTFIGVSNEILA